jgi:Na+/phosphate symporter
LALEGSVELWLERLKAGQELISAGSVTLVVFSLIGLILAILGIAAHKLEFGYIAFINLIMGSFVGLPLLFVGKARLKRATRQLSTSQVESNILDQKRSDDLLTTGLTAESPGLTVQGSVTEHTTLDLQRANGGKQG